MTKQELIERLECWIKQDLINMLTIKSINGCGGCNFPIVLYCLTTMEWIGFLTRDCRSNDREKQKTQENIGESLKYFNNPRYRGKYIKKILTEIFRHGLVHQFGPKAAGISRGNQLEFAIYTYNDSPVIDADLFAQDLIAAINNIVILINKNEEFFQNIQKKLNFLFEENTKTLHKVADEIIKSEKEYK